MNMHSVTSFVSSSEASLNLERGASVALASSRNERKSNGRKSTLATLSAGNSVWQLLHTRAAKHRTLELASVLADAKANAIRFKLSPLTPMRFKAQCEVCYHVVAAPVGLLRHRIALHTLKSFSMLLYFIYARAVPTAQRHSKSVAYCLLNHLQTNQSPLNKESA